MLTLHTASRAPLACIQGAEDFGCADEDFLSGLRSDSEHAGALGSEAGVDQPCIDS